MRGSLEELDLRHPGCSGRVSELQEGCSGCPILDGAVHMDSNAYSVHDCTWRPWEADSPRDKLLWPELP